MKQILKYGLIMGAVVILFAGGVWLLLRPGPSAMDYVPIAASDAASAEEYWPTEGWRTSTPEEQGFDSAKLADALQTLHKRNYAIDSLWQFGLTLLDEEQAGNTSGYYLAGCGKTLEVSCVLAYKKLTETRFPEGISIL